VSLGYQPKGEMSPFEAVRAEAFPPFMEAIPGSVRRDASPAPNHDIPGKPGGVRGTLMKGGPAGIRDRRSDETSICSAFASPSQGGYGVCSRRSIHAPRNAGTRGQENQTSQRSLLWLIFSLRSEIHPQWILARRGFLLLVRVRMLMGVGLRTGERVHSSTARLAVMTTTGLSQDHPPP
jgi:hypothetical protein